METLLSNFDDIGGPHNDPEWLSSLPIPHAALQRYYPNAQSARLGDSLEIETVQQALAEAAKSGIERSDKVRLQVAQHVAEKVHAALYFTPGNLHPQTSRLVMPSLGELHTNQRANCYGFTIVTSVLLEHIGVEHSIGFLNGHAIIVLFAGTGADTTAWMVDSTSPELQHNMSDLAPTVSFRDVRERMLETGRGVTTVSTSNFGAALGQPVEELPHKYRWLMKPPTPEEIFSGAEATARRTQLVLSIFDATRGRIALEQYPEYRNALAYDDPHSAAYELMGMGDLYPELDPQAPEHRFVRQMVEDMCSDPAADVDTLSLAEAINGYASSFGPNPPAAISTLVAECRDLIRQRDPTAIERAQDTLL